MPGRLQGEHFSIDVEKLAMVEGWIENVAVKAGTAREWLIDYDWPNAGEHQEWLDTASVEELADWVTAGEDGKA